MIRRHVTPALVISLCLLAGCLLQPRIHDEWRLLAAAGLACAAAAIPFLAIPSAAGTSSPVGSSGLHSRAFTRAGVLALSGSLGLLLGSLCMVRMDDSLQGSFVPVPLANATDFSGMLTQDSSLSRKGDTVLRVALSRASSHPQALSGSARGIAFVLLTGDYRFSMGENLSFHAPLSLSMGASGERFAAFVNRSEVHELGFASHVWELRARCRAWLHRAVSRAGYPASALLDALLIGSREDVPESLYDGFLRTGSLHILALSGLHVTVIYGIVIWLLAFVRRQWIRVLLAMLVLIFYQVLAGFMPSLLRATVMIVIGGVGIALDRDSEPVNLLAISCIVILLMDPFQVFSLSFQLSFLALVGILVIGPLVQGRLEGRVPRFLLLPLAMSVGAQAATLPLLIAQFGAYYPSGLAAGLLLVPLTTAFLWTGLAWLPLSAIPWPALHDACARLFSLFYGTVDACARVFSWIPGITFAGPGKTLAAIFAAGLLLALCMVLPLRPGMPLAAAKTT
jgi:competence protein ComEC